VTRWLVDGMNVIGAGAGGWWRDRDGAVRELSARLSRFAAARDEPLSVVFDGREPQPRPEAEAVEISFAAGGPNSADDEIAARVAADEDPAELTVVTSDRELAERARAGGAGVLGAGAFQRMLAEVDSET
jgi:predicted RNA-binding protein with PIN domain